MQAMTVAIGPVGIAYFAQQIVAKELAAALSAGQPPGRVLAVPDFTANTFGQSTSYTKIQVSLSGGHLTNFAAAYEGIVQLATAGQFTLTMRTRDFSANFAWQETYDWSSSGFGGTGSGTGKNSFLYAPGFAGLTTKVTLGFVWNATTKSYDVNVIGSPQATVDGPSANIPGKSILQSEDTRCFTGHLSDATASAMTAIDFSGLSLPALLDSIPASGNLTADIKYDFGLGDAGLTFPGNAGLAVGVTGAVTYKGAPYPGTPPASLPVPPPPAAADAHHLRLYVSGYELDALHWAFFQAGLLTVTVEPGGLRDPDVLKCKTYSGVKGFKPYAAFGMNARIAPKVAPTIDFRKVWQLTTAVEEVLRSQLPANVYALIDSAGIQGNAYADQAAFESDMTSVGVDTQYWPTIEQAAASMGMVLTQELEFTLTIENGAAPQPNLVFDVKRVDILGNLRLGARGGAQTLLFDFTHVGYDATFVSTTIPGFASQDFGDLIWPGAGEPQYDEALAAVGATGAPLPIMSGFHFIFEQAELSIQQGYVSILAAVALKTS